MRFLPGVEIFPPPPPLVVYPVSIHFLSASLRCSAFLGPHWSVGLSSASRRWRSVPGVRASCIPMAAGMHATEVKETAQPTALDQLGKALPSYSIGLYVIRVASRMAMQMIGVTYLEGEHSEVF